VYVSLGPSHDADGDVEWDVYDDEYDSMSDFLSDLDHSCGRAELNALMRSSSPLGRGLSQYNKAHDKVS
jgi:hypothetical protein